MVYVTGVKSSKKCTAFTRLLCPCGRCVRYYSSSWQTTCRHMKQVESPSVCVRLCTHVNDHLSRVEEIMRPEQPPPHPRCRAPSLPRSIFLLKRLHRLIRTFRSDFDVFHFIFLVRISIKQLFCSFSSRLVLRMSGWRFHRDPCGTVSCSCALSLQ